MKNYYKNLSNSYLYYLATKNSIFLEFSKNANYDFFNESLKKIKTNYAIKTEHKTQKNNKNYIYNIWEFNIQDNQADYLILILFEKINKQTQENGLFIFPKEIIEKIKNKKTITIFESDITGNYTKEPKINKNFYYNNFNLLKN